MPGDLAAPSDSGLVTRARKAKAALGDTVFVLGHHYQRDEVIEFADVTGDSLRLAQQAAARPDSPHIVFCGVHFMAESADILTSDDQTLILLDRAAAVRWPTWPASARSRGRVDELFDVFGDGIADIVRPVTYMNSTAAIKAFTGRHGGTICTSSNAKTALRWRRPDRRRRRHRQGAVPPRPAPRPHTAVRDARPVPRRVRPLGPAQAARRRHPGANGEGRRSGAGTAPCTAGSPSRQLCSARRDIPGVKVIVHPECRYEVHVGLADEIGSTERIIKTIAAAPDGTSWVVGTEPQPRQPAPTAVPSTSASRSSRRTSATARR